MCVCVCVCMCSGIFVDIANGMDNTRFGVATNHWEIMRCDRSPMSTGFIILIKTCIKTRSGTKDGFKDLVMRGKGVRYSMISVGRRLPLHVLLCVFDQSSKYVGLLLSTNILTLSGAHQLVMHAFDIVSFVILCSPFEYLVSFRVLSETMVRYT